MEAPELPPAEIHGANAQPYEKNEVCECAMSKQSINTGPPTHCNASPTLGMQNGPPTHGDTGDLNAQGLPLHIAAQKRNRYPLQSVHMHPSVKDITIGSYVRQCGVLCPAVLLTQSPEAGTRTQPRPQHHGHCRGSSLLYHSSWFKQGGSVLRNTSWLPRNKKSWHKKKNIIIFSKN